MAESNELTPPWEEARLAAMSHSELYRLRANTQNQGQQDKIANAEHRAFAREFINDPDNPAGPIGGAIGLAVAVPAYAAAKAAGLTNSRSNTSTDQVAESFTGIKEGLQQAYRKPWEDAQQAYKDASKYVVDKVSDVVGKISKGLLPWEEAQQAAKVVYVKPIQPSKKDVIAGILPNLIQAESGGVHQLPDGSLLKSSVGALGITQVKPETGKNPGYGITPLAGQTKEDYINFTKGYFDKMLDYYQGDKEKAVASYNAGVGTVDRLIKKYPDSWKQHLPSETKDYLLKVLRK